MCGPATLKMLLMYWNMPGQERADTDLAHDIGTDPVLGISNAAFISSLKKFGLEADAKTYGSFEDIARWLEKKTPVVVDWFSPGRRDAVEGDMPDGHYSIVVGLDALHVYLQDPETGGLRTIERRQFLRVWFDFEGDILTSPHEMVIRWMAAVYPAPVPKEL